MDKKPYSNTYNNYSTYSNNNLPPHIHYLNMKNSYPNQDDWRNAPVSNIGVGPSLLNQLRPLSYHDYNNQFISQSIAQGNNYNMRESSYQKKHSSHNLSYSNNPYYNRNVTSISFNNQQQANNM